MSRIEAIKAGLARPGAALFAIVFVSYAYFYQAGGWNQNSRFALVRSLVEQRSAAVDHYRAASWDLSCKGPAGICANRHKPDAAAGEHFYSDKAPGSSLLGVPVYGLVYALWGSDHPSDAYLAAASHLVTVASVSLPSALAVLLLFLMLEAFGLGAGRRAAVALAYGLGTLAFPYATLYYGHQLSAALLLIGFAMLVRARRLSVSSTEAPSPRILFVAGLALGSAVAVEYPAGLALVVIGIYALTFVRSWQRLAWLAAGVAIPALATAAYHWVVFGGPATLPYDFSVQDNRSQGWFMGLGVPHWIAVKNILFTGYRGIFYSAPWLLLAAPGGVVLWRRGFRAEVAVSAAVFVLFVCLNGALVDWSGGWAMSARYLIPALPFLALCAAGVLLGRGTVWTGVAGVGAVAAVLAAFLMLAGTAVKPEVPDVYVPTGARHNAVKIQRPFGEFIVPSFWRGELAINTQGIHQAGARRRGKAFVGKRHAFNVGQLLGLRGLASLVPLLLFWLLGGYWLVSSCRRFKSGEFADRDRP